MALDILHDNWGPYTHTEVENALKAYLTVLENRINQAIQSGGVGLADLSAEVQALLAKANTALQPESIAAWAKAQNKPGYNVSEITYSNLLTLAEKLADMDQKILAAAASGGVDPDDEMSSTSEKPVQNKVIKAYVDAAVLTLQNALNALMNGQSVTDAIDTFNEIKAFLEGIDTDDPTLFNQLKSLSDDITALQTTLSQKANDNAVVKSISVNGGNAQTPQNGNVNLQIQAGAQGPKGDTGNVQVDGNGNVLIVNNLDDGGTGAALSAEMGKRLAIKAGTYAGAWARSKAVIVPFAWLWTETVGGAAICKPIWHIGNSVFVDAAGGIVSVQAAAIPATPTFSETSGSTVGKGTELTITPAVDSALYYKIGNGAWIISDVAVTIEINATCTVTAKCVNNAGSSNEVPCSLTVSGPQAPSFEATQGTTIDSNNVVSRGGSIVVSVPQGGELHYRVNEGAWQTSQNGTETFAIATNRNNQGKMIIDAYNVQDNDQSGTSNKEYTMAALAAPSMSPANNTEFPAGGSTATITATEGDGIRYTTDGSDARTSNTATVVNALTASVAVSSAVTIKACAFDDYGKSDLVQATYSVETAKLKVTASAATTMTLTKTDDTTVELTIAQDDNEFAIDTALGGVTTFKSCAFGDKTLITKIDFGGITINSIEQLFSGCASLLECKNLFVNGSAYRAFYDCTNLASSSSSQLSLGGVITNGQCMLMQTTGRVKGGGVDLSRVTSITNVSQIFNGFRGSEPIDLSHTVVNVSTDNNTWLMYMFKQVQASTLIIGEFIIPSGVTRMDQMFYDAMITTIKCTTSTPPVLTCDWIGTWKTRVDAISNATPKILVPAAAENAYKTASGWSTYANIMETY